MMNYLIIDDEPLAHNVIKRYSQHLPHLQCKGSCFNAFEAITFLSNYQVELIFLDINMPKLKGLDFLRTLSHPPIVIITTAYQEFALESYDLSVCDYLLKPYSLERFLKAVNKAQRQLSLEKAASSANVPSTITPTVPPRFFGEEPLLIKGDKKIHRIHLEEILYLEGAGSYVKVHLADEMIMTLERLGHFETILPDDRFVRIHKSFIVPIQKVTTIEKNVLMIKSHKIPIGKVYKHNLSKVFKRN